MMEHLQAAKTELDIDLAIQAQGAEIERALAQRRREPPTLYAASEPGAVGLSSALEPGDDAAAYLRASQPLRAAANPNASAEAFALAHPYPNGRWG